MVVNFKVYKKSSPNGKLTLYLGKRDFIDYLSGTEHIDGILLINDQDYINNERKIWGQLICSFRYGREKDEVMGLNFQKNLYLTSEQLYPIIKKTDNNYTKLQERLIKKLGNNAIPFTFKFPQCSPPSVTLAQGDDDYDDDDNNNNNNNNNVGEPCGVTYYIKLFCGDNDSDISHKRSTINICIKKIQYAPTKQGHQPYTIVKKDFLLSPGELELEVTLDKQLYKYDDDTIAVNICVRNNSNKMVKKIKALVQQGIDVVMFQNGQFRTVIDSIEIQDGCPINPGSTLQKIIYLKVNIGNNKPPKRGIALDPKLKNDIHNNNNNQLATSTLLTTSDIRDSFGIVVSYAIKVKLYLGALGGELCAELPFILMRSKPTDRLVFNQTDNNDEKIKKY